MDIKVVDYLSLGPTERLLAKEVLKKNIRPNENSFYDEEPAGSISKNIDSHFKSLEDGVSGQHKSFVILRDSVPVATIFGKIVGKKERALQVYFIASPDFKTNSFFLSRFNRPAGQELLLRLFYWAKRKKCLNLNIVDPSLSSIRSFGRKWATSWLKMIKKNTYVIESLPRPARIGLAGSRIKAKR